MVLYLTLSLKAMNKGKGRGGFGRKSGLTREVQESVSCLQKMPCEMNVLCVCDCFLLTASWFQVTLLSETKAEVFEHPRASNVLWNILSKPAALVRCLGD